MPRAEYALFLRAALPGAVKTRLIPALGAGGACDLYRRLREHVLALFTGERACDLTLWVTPGADAELGAWAARFGWRIELQVGDDLGQRMAFAVRVGLSRAGRVVLLGADCPGIDDGDLRAAAEADATVLGVAEDGGYWLLSLAEPLPALFIDMPWGGSEVAAITRQRLAAIGREWRELAVRADVDRPRDLPALAQVDWRRLPAAGSRPAPG